MNKILRYNQYKEIILPLERIFVFRYCFSLIEESKIDTPEEENETEEINIDVEISWIKAASWNLLCGSSYHPDLIKILFEYGKRELIEKIKDLTIEKNNTLRIYTNTHTEETCPFNPEIIKMNEGQEFLISVPEKTLKQTITEDNIAFLIITKRDEINALFKSKYKDKLLTISQERNLLEFFRSAESIEEFSYRVTALGNLVGSLNKDMLSKATNQTKSNRSIQLLESLLSNISTDQKVAEIFRNLISLRKAYPVHGDNVEGVVEAHKYFELDYPVKDFEKSWNKIKSAYCNALNELFEIVKSFESES